MRQFIIAVCMVVMSLDAYATPSHGDGPNPRGRALGHQREDNPHYVAPVVEEGPTFDVCPFLQSAPHMCVNWNPQ